jgi:hypothetical protein
LCSLSLLYLFCSCFFSPSKGSELLGMAIIRCFLHARPIKHTALDIIRGFLFRKNIHYLIKSIQTSLCSSKLKPRCHYDRTYWCKKRQKVVCCSARSR